MEFQDLVGLAPWTFIAQICNLFIQIALFKKFLFKPVKKIIAERQQQINGIYDSAAEAEKTAQDNRAQYERLLGGAKDEAQELVRDAAVRAQRQSDEIVRAAEQEASAIRERANAAVAQEKKKALNEMKDEISGLAMEIASRVVEREVSEQDHRALVEEFLGKLEEQA